LTIQLSGATYMEIHKAGGGINFTVENTKNASEEVLEKSLNERLSAAMRTGTTFVECKTGYGLEWETEYKLLRVLTKVNRDSTICKPGMSITYLAAHAIPK
jgi:imidazolonepropionase